MGQSLLIFVLVFVVSVIGILSPSLDEQEKEYANDDERLNNAVEYYRCVIGRSHKHEKV